MGFGLGQLGGLGRLGQHTLNQGVGDIITSIFADGTDGFYSDFSKTDQLFQNLTGTPADDAGENIYLGLESHAWGGKTLTQVLAAQPEVLTNGDFSGGATGWTVQNADATHIATFSGGTLRYQSDTTSPVLSVFQTPLTAGKLYRVETVCSAYVSGSVKEGATGVVLAAGVGTTVFYIRPPTTSFSFQRNSANVDLTIDSVSIKEVPGNHGLQATTSAQPKWQTGGIARFDGADDCLPTPLQIANAGSLVVKFNKAAGNSGQAIIGQRSTTADDVFITLNNSGFVSAAVAAGATIAGSVNLAGVDVVAAITWDGVTANLYAQGALIATQAQSGAVAATAPVVVGSARTDSLFAAVDIYRALAIKKALSAAEIQAITNQWGTA